MALFRCASASGSGEQVSKELGFVNPTTKYGATGKVSTGFKVKYLIGSFLYNSSQVITFVYDEDTSTTKYKRYIGSGIEDVTLNTTVTGLKSIDSTDGFTLDPTNLSLMSYFTYIAIG